jgi:hypothetical protein
MERSFTEIKIEVFARVGDKADFSDYNAIIPRWSREIA